MPSQVRIISKRNSAQWDDLVRQVLDGGALEVEHDYFGVTTQARADEVRKKLRTAGRHHGVGSKVYYKECPSPGKCKTGGADCAYHVYYTIYDLEKARGYKAKQATAKR